VGRLSRRFVSYWLPVLAWMGVIFFGTSLPRAPQLMEFGGGDKIAHAAGYAVLGLLLLRAFRGSARYPAPLAAFVSLVAGGAYGVLDELHQALLPTRTCSGADMLADLVGLTAAVMLGWAFGAALALRQGQAGRVGNSRLASEVPCLVDFWAPWCGPCHMVVPIIEKMAAEYDGKLKVRRLNVDEAPALATRYNIRSIPALILYKGGEAVDMLIGVQPEANFREAIDEVLGETQVKVEETKEVADGNVGEITQADFDREVLQSKMLCLVDFWAPWCGPCHMVVPIIEKMAAEYDGKLKVRRLNVDQAPQLATRYNIRSIPALILYKNGTSGASRH